MQSVVPTSRLDLDARCPLILKDNLQSLCHWVDGQWSTLLYRLLEEFFRRRSGLQLRIDSEWL
jgi:hypothetical protein